ncbi:MAG: hypothetical protein GXN92_02985 [Candidatus Micrarchaeota archaeon]|nr:hypothetical protein [Candidatus Micrarchaeota archaeon]
MEIPEKVREYIKKGGILVELYFDFSIVMPDAESREKMWKVFGKPSEEVIQQSAGFARKHIYEIAQQHPPEKWLEEVEKKKEEVRKELEEHLTNVAAGFAQSFIADLVKKEKIWFGVADINPPIWEGETLSNYAVVTLVFRKFSGLVETVALYHPAGIEIIEPEYLELDVGEVQDALNKLSKIVYETKLNMLTEEKKRELLKAYKQREEIGKRVRERVLHRDQRTG